jgi:hypothetical protein
MRTARLICSALAAASIFGATSAYAADACLRSTNIRGWDVVDSRTLMVTNNRREQFRVDLVGVCSGLDNANIALGFESLSELSCLGSGDSVHYNDVAFGHQRCTISSVEQVETPEDEAADAGN